MPTERRSVWLASTYHCNGEANRRGGREKRPVTGHNDEVGVSSPQRAGEVDGVVSAEPVRFSEIARLSNKPLVDTDDVDLGIQVVEMLDGGSELPWGDPAHPLRLRKRSPPFGIQERDGDNP